MLFPGTRETPTFRKNGRLWGLKEFFCTDRLPPGKLAAWRDTNNGGVWAAQALQL